MGNKFYKRYKESLVLFDDFVSSEEGKSIFSDEKFEDSKLLKVVYYDSFNNNSIKKLIRKLHKLNKKDYKLKHIDTSYAVRKKQFITFQDTYSNVGIFADIEVLNNKYISSVHISWCQRSNYNAMLEFKIHFKKAFESFQEEYDFIQEQMKKKTTKTLKYYNEYSPDFIQFKGQGREYEYIKMHNKFLDFAFQTYLTETFYSENGLENELYSIHVFNVDEDVLKVYDAPFLGLMGLNKSKKSKFILDFRPSRSHPTSKITVLTSNYGFDTRNILGLFSEYRNLLYYNVYFDVELNKLNQRIAPYNIGVVKKYTFKDMKWMFTKLAELKSSRDNGDSDLEEKLNTRLLKDWDVYYGTYEGDKKQNIRFDKLIHKSKIEFVLEKYLEQYDLYKIALETQSNSRNLRIAMTSLVLAIIAIIISIGFPVIFSS